MQKILLRLLDGLRSLTVILSKYKANAFVSGALTRLKSRQTCKDSQDIAYHCGQKSAFALADWLDQSQPVRCELRYKDRYKRFVARCFRFSGEDIAEWLVRNGYAIDWPKYSNGFYAVPQNEARQAKVGILQGSFVEPWLFRKKK